MSDSNDFDEGNGLKGSLVSILQILADKEADEHTLLSVTLPSSLWFDMLQALTVSGSVLTEIHDQIPSEIPQKEQCAEAIEKVKVVYNEIYDCLVRFANQEVSK